MNLISKARMLVVMRQLIDHADETLHVKKNEGWISEEISILGSLGFVKTLTLTDTEDASLAHVLPERLTDKGGKFVLENSWASWWDLQWTSVKSNIVTIALAVLIALGTAWMIEFAGPEAVRSEIVGED